MKQRILFDRVSLENHSLKNRLTVAPMTRTSATADGLVTTEIVRYYESMAEGGFAAIITEGVYTDMLHSQALPFQPGIATTEQAESWKKITAAIHRHGAMAICQLMHGGALVSDTVMPIAPSSIRPKGYTMTKGGVGRMPYAIPKEMTLVDIESVRNGFITAARFACEAGFDGVEIHAANGYLLDQFITPHTNQRIDAYGGTMAHRYRIIYEIIEGVKSALPEGFIIGLRISESKVNDLAYRWPEGPDFARQLLDEIVKCIPTYLHVAAEGGNWERECRYADGTSSSGLAKETLGIPVIANGGLDDVQLAEHLINTGHADLIAIGRAAIADPAWAHKLEQGIPPVPFQREMISPHFTLANTATYFKQHG